MTYEIGQFYMVPCVLGAWSRCKPRYWPVMGREHEDKEIIKFPERHYHIDWRFVGRPYVDDFRAVFSKLSGNPLAHNYAVPLMTSKRMNIGGLPKPILRRRKCYREHALPFDMRPISWLPALEKAHAGCTLAAGRVCPHRGYDLSHEPVNADGTITCPMHGLRWNAATGELAPRP